MKYPFGKIAASILALVLIVTAAYPVQASDNGKPLAANALPVITVWYQQSLKFGQIGNPQSQVNILGNVSDSDGSITSLTYILNKGAKTALSIGPNSTRLINKGDFNVAINTTSLNLTNTLEFTATDNAGGETTKTITFPYSHTRTWPLPYVTSWGTAASIHDQAQVVDGLWQLSASGVRPQLIGYDRLIAIGETTWSDYEVTVPITIRGFVPDPNNPSDSGGVGVIVRWQGHIGTAQPPTGWTRLGAYGYYSNRLGNLALRLNDTDVREQKFSFVSGKTYIFKLRAETVAQGGRYSLKVWEQGQPEPAWNSSQFGNIYNVVDSAGDLMQGSILLVAHRADATFGNVTICPLNTTYPLAVTTKGSGNVTATPNKSTFSCGESANLSAQAAPGSVFVNWSGDVSSNNPTISINMTKAYNVTANFRVSQPVNLDVKSYVPVTFR